MPNEILRVVARIIALALAVALSSGACFAQKKAKLDKSYREWLERDVAYIITKDERDEFLKLTTNEARDKFIDQFWEVRNPNPGTGTNSYKEEIYQRIAFANARFGDEAGGEGWRTDRGRTYITLGAPKQKQILRSAANLRPIEIWFYSNDHPSLPPFFYVMFYQREYTGEYKFYSPYTDGPDKLVTNTESINSPTAALRVIQDSAGPEVARTSLSLLPDEPVDLTNARASLQSDILLSTIKNLANTRFNREEIQRRRELVGSVKARMILEGRNLDIFTQPVRDSRGQTRLDYAIRLHAPSDLLLTSSSDGRSTYSVEVQVRVFGPDDKPVFTRQNTVTDSLDAHSVARIKDKVFGYEGLLPLAPGKYRINFQLTDWNRKTAYQVQREIVIPEPNKDALTIPGLFSFVSAEAVDPALADVTPFAMGGLRFNPMVGPVPTLSPEGDLQIVYQIWALPKDPRRLLGEKLHVEYALGKPATSGGATVVTDDIPMEQFDATGSLVTGKKLSLNQTSLGNYLLTLSADSQGVNRAFAKMNLRILSGAAVLESWDVLEPTVVHDAQTGVLDQQRGLSYLAQGHADEARVCFRRALQLDHADDVARARLVDAYFARADYAAVVSLYNDAGVTDHTDSETILRIATSFAKSGKPTEAIAILEAALHAHSQDGPLYLALAGYYNQIGDARKAAELTEKGKSYLSPSRE